METTVVSSWDEHLGARPATVDLSEEAHPASLDVFGTEALDSVCGVDILDPVYRHDVKRVLCLWSLLVFLGTAVLTLGFFGCFRRLKGETLDLSRNLWSEDLFWTSLTHFMLTCLAVTCGFSALASHTNLYSHAKVLGFRRVFRWCLALHAAAALFTLAVGSKLTVIDLLEPEYATVLPMKRKTADSNRALQGPIDVYVYAPGRHTPYPVASSSLSPTAFTLLRSRTVTTGQPPSAGASKPAETAFLRAGALAVPTLSFPENHLLDRSTPQRDFSRRLSKHRREARLALYGEGFNSSLQLRDITREAASPVEQSPTVKEKNPQGSLLQSGIPQKPKERPGAASIYPSQWVHGRDYSRGPLQSFAGSHTNVETPVLSTENRSKKGAQKIAPAPMRANEEAQEPIYRSRAAGSQILEVPEDQEPRQRPRHAAQLNHRPGGALVAELQIKAAGQLVSSPKCLFEIVSSAKTFARSNHRNTVTSDAQVLLGPQPTRLPSALVDARFYGKTHSQRLTADHYPKRAPVSFFADGSEESGESPSGSADAEVKNDLRPVRDSPIYKLMLFLVVVLDYIAAVTHIICFLYTWHLACKIGDLFGLKILKIPF